MSWLQLDLTLAAAEVEPAETALLAAGALSVTCQDAAHHPLYAPSPAHPPVWPETRLSVLLPAAADPDSVRALLIAVLDRLPAHQFISVEDREWSRVWLKDFRPMRFGRRLWIVPSAYEPPDPAAVNIRLDPGLAFGTGTHPTTALCLEWLDAAELRGCTVIDYGCGSGILALAAARLGAQQVYAVDNDRQARTATQANAKRNQVAHLIQVRSPEEPCTVGADVLIANILAAPLCELASRFATLVKPEGHIVLSGILEEQRNEIHAAYAQQGFRIAHVAQREEWLRMDGRRLSGDH